jgi:hypothetical protein
LSCQSAQKQQKLSLDVRARGLEATSRSGVAPEADALQRSSDAASVFCSGLDAFSLSVAVSFSHDVVRQLRN